MNTKFDFGQAAADRIAYVRAVNVADLPADVQAQAEGLVQLYALHDASGERLALVRDRAMAFKLAHQNQLDPVAVH